MDPKLESGIPVEDTQSPPLELRRDSRRTPHERATDSPQIAQVYMMHSAAGRLVPPPQFSAGPAGTVQPRNYFEPPPAHLRSQYSIPGSEPPVPERVLSPQRDSRKQLVGTPPHPPPPDSFITLLERYPVMWQGILALKNDQAAVQMHFVYGNPNVASGSLLCKSDGSTPPLRIAQRMRLEPTQVAGVTGKMQVGFGLNLFFDFFYTKFLRIYNKYYFLTQHDNEHCMLLALPCGRDHMDVLQQSKNLQSGFITYLQQKQAAGIVNIAAPGSQEVNFYKLLCLLNEDSRKFLTHYPFLFQVAFVVHIFPSCDFANENFARIAPDLLHRVSDIAHLIIVITTV